MLRIALIAGALLVVGGLLSDPYTYFADTYSPFAPAPFWRVGLSVLELALLLIYCVFTWRRRYRRAGLLLCSATFLNLVANAFFVSTEGVDRFLVAIGTEEILTVYLILLALRVAMIAVTCALPPRPGSVTL